MIWRWRVVAPVFVALAMGLAKAQSAAPKVPSSNGERAARLQMIQRSLLDQMDRLNRKLAPHGGAGSADAGDVTTRDLTNASLLILRTHGAPVSAEILLRRVFTVQNMDRTSSGYGMLPWQLNDAQIKDANAIEFGMQALGAVFLGYGDQMSGGFKKDADGHLHAALVALANHHVKVSYTNIFLMNTMDTIELAEYLNDTAALHRGEEQWKQWCDYTNAYSVHEFDSPTYYAVDLGDLVLGFLYVKDAEIHRQIEAALNMFWRDIAASYLAAAGHLAGAHSRDYYPLTGRGGIEYYLYLEGLLQYPVGGKFADVFLENVDLLESERPGGYRAPQKILELAKLPERVIEQRWDEDPAAIRYTYLTQGYAMGFATGHYSDQDKMFAADLTSVAPLTSITLVPDVLDSPYGLIKARDRSGHMKPTHLALNLSGVEEKGTALLVTDLDPETAVDNPTFATNVILPSAADRIVVDQTVVKVSPSLDESVSIGAIIGVRAGTSCFVTRLLAVDALNGAAAEIRLRADSTGLAHGALRLAIYHASKAFSSPDTRHLHVAVLVSIASCSSDSALAAQMQRLRDAQVHSSERDGGWAGTVQIGSLQLELKEDATTRRNTNASINGQPITSPVFALNGRAMGLGLAGFAGAEAGSSAMHP